MRRRQKAEFVHLQVQESNAWLLSHSKQEGKAARAREGAILSDLKAGKDVGRNTELLVKAHMGFIIFMANRFGKRYPDMIDDLISEAVIGFMHGIEKYDPSYGTKLLSYAAYWVRANMTRYMFRNWNRTGMREGLLVKYYFQLQRESKRLEALGYTGEDLHAELAQAIGVSPAQLTRLLIVKNQCSSLEGGIDENGMPLVNTIQAEEVPPSDRLEKEKLHQALGCLMERERFVIRHTVMQGNTLEATGQILGVSRERVRQIQAKALGKLRTILVKIPEFAELQESK